MPVIRIGHGSTVPYGEYPVIGLHHLEVVGCSKLSTIQREAIAQLAEYRIVYPKVAGSNPVSLAYIIF
tara:strand:- start:138 stop:341 length:204 start_codon:yes stop_codon:yes gene_type:complete